MKPTFKPGGRAILCLLCLICLPARFLSAQGLVVDQSVIVFGGGTITGGPEITGSLGQPLAGSVSGGGKEFYSAYWEVLRAYAFTDIALGSSTVLENQPVGTVVGGLSAPDPEDGSAATFTLVAGTGDTDNGSFTISGTNLVTMAVFNYEAKSSYNIRLRATDSFGEYYEKAVTITVLNVNEAPSNISLSGASVNENIAVGSTVGTLSVVDVDAGDTATFTFVTGTGSTDNGYFNISGTSLKTKLAIDYETKSSLSCRVRVTDGGGLAYEKVLTVTVNNVNEAPTAISLSATSVLENSGTTVGTFTATDPDAGNTITFSLVSGYGDNASFTIAGTTLNGTAAFNYESKSSYSLKVRATDNGGLTFDKTFTISVTDVNEAPTLDALTSVTLLEDAAAQAVNLTGISTGGGESQTLTVTASSSNTGLIPAPTISYVSASSSGTLTYTPMANANGTATLTVTVTDSGNTANGGIKAVSQSFIVVVNSVNDAPTLDALTSMTVDENAGVQTVNLSGISTGAANETQALTVTATSSNTGLIPNPTVTYSSPNAAGTLTCTPAVLGANGSALITVTVTDNGSTANGGVTTTTRTFTVNVTGVNDAPTLTTISAPAAILEDAGLQTINLSGITAGGGESQTLTVTAASSNTGRIPHPAVTYASPNTTGTLAYSPMANANGNVTITVTVTDSGNTANGGVNTTISTFKVTVTAVNDAPTLDVLTNVTLNEDAGAQAVNLTGINSGPASESGQTLTITASSSNIALIPHPSLTYASPNSTGTLTCTPMANAHGTATITVTVTDSGGTANGGVNTTTRTFSVTVNSISDAPTDILLSAASLNENLASGTTVGTLTAPDADAGDTATFTLVSGGGSTDNASFTIDGNALKTTAAFNYETKSGYAIRLRVTDSTSLTFEKEFTIGVNDANETPTDIAMAVAGVNENAAVGSLAGTLGATDVDAGDTATFTLVAGTGDTGNANFAISGTNLLTTVALDFETATSHSVRVRVTDAGGLTFEEVFTVAVANVNEAPMDISLSAASLYENTATGTTIGTLTTSDVDAGDTATLTLVSGALNNNKFSITGTVLKNGEAFNFEAKSSYGVRVRVTDGGNNTFDKDFTIIVLDTNEPPTGLVLSASTVAENQAANTFIGSFSATEPDAGDTKTFALVSGTGDTDNGSFTIATRHLKTAAVFDYEAKSSYSIRAAVFDSGGLGVTNIYTITVNNVNEAPATPALSASTVAESAASGTTIGTLTAPDPDAGDTVTFSLVSGTGDANNGAFAIVGSTLKTAAVFDRETQPTQSVRVRATDSAGLTAESTFTITVNNVNEGPADIVLSATSIAENSASGSTVGTLTASDVDAGDTAAFALVSGTGSTDNSSFSIVSGALKTAAVFNYETKSSYSIRLRVTDGGGLTFEKAFTVTVSDVNEAPTNISLSSSTIAENQEIGATVGVLSATEPDIGDTATFTLVSGTGSTDNGSFVMDGSALTTAESFDYEAKNTYSIRVQVTDGGASTFEKALTITVLNLPDTHVLAGTPLWTNLFNGLANTNDQAAAIATDTNSNVFVAGFRQTGAASTKDYLTVAYSSLGVPLWTNSYGGPGNNADEATAVAVNTNGDVIVTGFSRSGGVNTEDFATVAYSSAGVALWTNRYNGPGNNIDQALALAIDSTGNVYVTGYSHNGTDNDFATVAYSSAGVPLWTNRYNGPGNGDDQAKKVAADASGNVFVTGYSFNGTDNDFATVAYSSAGTPLWTNRYNGTGNAADAATAVAVDGSGNVYVTGSSANGSNNDYATIAYSSAGVALWTNRFNPNSSTDNANAIAVDDNGNVYVTGESAGGGGGSDYMTVAYSSAGALLWTNRYNGPGNNNDTARAITVHNNSIVYVTGVARTSTTAASEDFATVAYSTSGTPLWTNRFNGAGNVSDQALAGAVDAAGDVLVAGYAHNGTNNDFTTIKYAGNFAPTNITLSASSVNENAASGTTVGTLSAADPDTGDTATYSLVSGTGGSDNGNFTISSGALKTAAVFDYETKSSYSIRVRATDSGKLTFDKVFTIAVNNVNDSPTDISLTASSVVEHAASGASVGVLSTTDADAGDSATFTLVSGTGSADNASFGVSDGTNLVTATVFDYEVKNSYSLRVRATDSGGLTFEKAFTITVVNTNEAPTDIGLSAATVAENAASATTIGTLTTTDVDAGDTKTFSFATGTGDTDNGSFSIVGSTLKTAAVLNYEVKNSYSVRVRVTDAGGLTYDEVFVVDVTNVNETPTDISLSSTSVGEDAASGSTVGTLSAADQDNGEILTFALVSGTGSTDNGAFTLDGTSLTTATALDYETKNEYSIRVRVTDSTSLTFEKVLTISVTNVNEAPTAISLSASSVAENAASGMAVGTFTATDVDTGDTRNFTLVSGTGDTDNASFSINNGSNLVTAAVFNFEAKSSYSIRARVTDGGVLTFENAFTITVTNVNEGPTDILATGYTADWASMGASVPGMVGPSSSQIRAIVTNGNNIYVGGTFSVAGTVVASNIAKWNGTAWSALGAGLAGTVNALAQDVSGNLYAGGSFTNVGGSGANYIAKWNGTTWASLGTGLGGAVNALAFDASGNLYAGGSFTNAGGVSASRVAKWNGSAWASLGSGVNSTVSALAVDASGNVFVGGGFATAGGTTVNRIAKWDGSAWSALGTGMSGGTPSTLVNALAVDGSGNLYAGGVFTSAGGTSASRIAKWNGSAWSALGTGIPNTVNALVLDGGGNLYVGGVFSTAGGTSAANIAKWNGSAWSALGTGLSSTAFALALDATGNLYAGGNFTTAGGIAARAFATWNGSVWSATDTWTGVDNQIQAVIHVGTNLYVGGSFVTAGGITVNGIARWNGSAWFALGSGVAGGDVLCLAAIGTELYVGGSFTSAGGVASTTRIAKWNGTAWSAMGTGGNNAVAAFAVLGTDLYAGGAFTAMGGVANTARIARWNGTSWSALGTGCDNTVRALAVSGTDLYVGGSIDFAGGISAKSVAKWSTTGSTWSALGTGLNSAVRALAIDGSGNLCVGGDFTTAGGISANRIAKWNGSAWSTIGSSGMNNPVYALAVDGGGNLYAGGGFSTADGSPANRVAKWNGSAWSTVGSGMDGSANQSVLAMTFLGSDLYAGGGFTTASGKASPYLARAQIGVAENAPIGTTVATLTAADVDAGDTRNFTLVTGTGDTDNGAFTIVGDALKTATALDYETKGNYTVRVRVTDGGGLSVEKAFGISVTNVNDTPTDISLSAASVAENQPSGSIVGTLATADQDAGDTVVFSLVSGAGSADNASFTLAGTTLQTAASFDYETKSSYSLRVRATDSGGLTYEEAFTITVNNVNDAPMDISLSAASVAENVASGATVGSFTATDADAGDTAAFTFVGGIGSEDNGAFTLSGGTLQTAAVFDYEVKSSYSVRVLLTDSGGLTFEKVFTLAVSDVNEAPVDIALSAASVAENAASGTGIGSFTATDVDAGDAHIFTLVSGAGGADNANFTIAGGTLQTAGALDFETKGAHSIRVRATDAGGLFAEKQFTVTVTDANDAPSNISLSANSVAENAASGMTVGTLAAADQDAGDTATFALVSGAGDMDNASFTLAGSTLRTAASFDYETKRSLSLRVRAVDGGGLTFEQQLTVSVTEVYEYTAGWTNRYNGPVSGFDQATAVAADAAGNVFVAGYSHNGTDNDYVTIKYLADGTAAWTNRYNGPGNSDDAANALVVDESGNVYVTGHSQGAGTSRDYATIKYLADGTPAWTNRYDGPGNMDDVADALAMDAVGNVFVTGWSRRTTSAGSEDYATIKYLADGTPAWTNRFNGSGDGFDVGNALIVDGSGNVIVTGASPGSGTGNDYATVKYLSDGTSVWTNRYNGPANTSDSGNAITTDGAGNVLVTGQSNGSGSGSDYATIKYLSDGTPAWTNHYNGPGNSTDQALSIGVDASGNIYVTGSSRQTSSSGSEDYATLAYSSAGVPLWTNRYAGPGSGQDVARGLVLDSAGNVFVMGNSPGSGTGDDFATVKYSSVGAPVWTNRYNGPASGTDVARAIATDHAGNVFVAGNSAGSGTSADFAVVKYAARTAPASILLSAASVAENSEAGTSVGTFTAPDVDPDDTAAFTLVSGAGDTDNASFSIVDSALQTAASFDYETKNSYSIRVRATDGLGLTYEQEFTVTVANVNEAPSTPDLDNIFIAENQPSGTVVGVLSSSDADAGDTVTYTLVSGDGDADNASFTVINGTNLATTAAFNYEAQDVFTLRVRATDGGGLFTEQQFYIVVDDLIEAPNNILLSNAGVAENQADGAAVGSLAVVDQDIGDTAAFAFIAGSGGDDNGSFSIVNGTNLVTTATFNYEVKSSYSVRVRVTDSGGLSFEEAFVISVGDVNEGPADVSLSASSVVENAAAGTSVGTLTAADADAGDSVTFALVSGAGSADNGSFSLVGAALQTAAVFNYEVKSSYSVRVRVTDGGGLSFEKPFTISVANANEAPTDISLSAASVAENAPVGTTIGTLTAADVDAGDTVGFTLVGGAGGVDNGLFAIVGGALQTAAVFNYEVKSSYSVRVRVTDSGGLSFEEAFVISVGDVNEGPADVSLSASSVVENAAAGTSVGTLTAADADAGDSVTFALVSGAGSADNGSFSLVGAALQTAAVFNYEVKSSYSVRVRVTDGGGLSFEKPFTISVANANEAPTDISLSAASVAENAPVGTTIGTLTAADVDAGDTVGFTLVGGAGGVDNGLFAIVGGALQTAAVFNYEVKSSYSVRVRVTDSGGLSFEEAFVISVGDVNEGPADVSLSASSVAENAAAGTSVGTFTAADADAGDSATFALVSGAGSADNGSFSLVGAALQTAAVFNYEVKSSYSVRVRVTDGGGLSFEKPFTISVANANEAPTDISLSAASVAENAPVGTVVGVLASLEYDLVDTAAFALARGEGDSDNALFSISDGTNLVTTVVFDYEGDISSRSIRVRVTDGATNVFERPFIITVTDVNEFTLTNQTVALTEDTGAQQIILGSSVARGATYLVLGGPAHGTVSVFGNVATYTAHNNFQGLDTFSYILSNALGTSTLATVTVTVANVNDILPYAFSNAVNYGVGLAPAAIVAGKFGKTIGLAVANYSNNTVSLLLNSGKGYFTNAVPPTVSVGNGPIALATANFNSHTNLDTKPDLVVVHKLDETIQVLLGDGLGGFTNLTPVPVGNNPSAVAVGDLNKDGKVDAVVANEDDNNITVLLGHGDGAFRTGTNHTVGTNPVSVVVADLNKDMKADVATANYGENTVSVLWGVGTGFLSNAVNYAVGVNPNALAAGDFNKDGRVDLVVANYGDDTISVLMSVRQTNSGVRTNTFTRTDYPVGINPSAVVVTNINKDTYQDIIVAGYYENTVQVLLGRTNGAFEPYYNDPSATEPVGTNPIALAVGNFNTDTDLDVAVANWGSGNVSILLNNYTPVAYGQKLNVVEDTATPITLTATFGPLNYLILTGPTNGSFILTNGAMSNATASPVLTYLPSTNANGKDLITFKVQDDGGKTSKVVKVEILIVPVNDAPSFTLTGNAIELAEDSVKQSLLNFATNLNRGASGHATEIKQMLSFVVTNSASNLFKVQPAIALAGTNTVLTFEPAKNAHGAATVGVILKDKSGTANGGADTSAQAFFTLTITNVNDTPALFNWPAAFPAVKTNSSTNITFAVWDYDTGTSDLYYSVNWTNTTLFADSASKGSLTAFASTNFAFGTAGTNRMLTIFPAFGQKGTDKLIVTIYDGTNSVSKTNAVTVK